MTRLIRIQLSFFIVLSIIGFTQIIFGYMQAPTFLGVDRLIVKLELPNAGGLYRFANVTLRGVQIGKVLAVDLTRGGAEATLSLDRSPLIPADLQAEVRSVSAVGEQYVDLIPRANSAPFLRDGSVIVSKDTTVPQPVGPLLDQVSALIGSVPTDKTAAALDEAYRAFGGTGSDLASMVDSSSTLANDLNSVADRTRTLVEDSRPLLDSQADTTDTIRVLAHGLAGVTRQLATDDPQVRSLLQNGPGLADEVSGELDQIKPTLPIVLANLSSLSQITLTYNASIEQLLVLQPPLMAATQTFSPINNPAGFQMAEIPITVDDPPACTVGFLPPSSWRSPADVTEADTPDGLYCKLPQDSPLAVRGVRNFPCMKYPGKRAPTVQMCDSDKPYDPLAMRQHVLGPRPLDPNLIAQGVPPDQRIDPSDKLFGPLTGTPLPGVPGAATTGPPDVPATAGYPPAAPDLAPPDVPDVVSPPHGTGGGAAAAPSSFGNASRQTPSISAVQYDPSRGTYVAAHNQLFTQTDLVPRTSPKTWKDLILGAL